jgi:hypothetical protein
VDAPEPADNSGGLQRRLFPGDQAVPVPPAAGGETTNAVAAAIPDFGRPAIDGSAKANAEALAANRHDGSPGGGGDPAIPVAGVAAPGFPHRTVPADLARLINSRAAASSVDSKAEPAPVKDSSAGNDDAVITHRRRVEDEVPQRPRIEPLPANPVPLRPIDRGSVHRFIGTEPEQGAGIVKRELGAASGGGTLGRFEAAQRERAQTGEGAEGRNVGAPPLVL